MDLKVINTWYFERSAYISQLLLIYPGSILHYDFSYKLSTLLMLDLLFIYLLSTILIKSIRMSDRDIEIVWITRLLKRKKVISFNQISKIYCKNSRLAGSLNEFWLYFVGSRIPFFFTISGNKNEIRNIIQCFESKGITIKSKLFN